MFGSPGLVSGSTRLRLMIRVLIIEWTVLRTWNAECEGSEGGATASGRVEELLVRMAEEDLYDTCVVREVTNALGVGVQGDCDKEAQPLAASQEVREGAVQTGGNTDSSAGA